MKNLRKVQFGLLAVLLAVGIVFGMSAFKTKAKTPVVYEYTSNSHLPADIKDIDNWEVATPNTPSCGDEGDLVCRYQFEGDMSDFQSYLELPNTLATDINDNALNKKQ